MDTNRMVTTMGAEATESFLQNGIKAGTITKVNTPKGVEYFSNPTAFKLQVAESIGAGIGQNAPAIASSILQAISTLGNDKDAAEALKTLKEVGSVTALSFIPFVPGKSVRTDLPADAIINRLNSGKDVTSEFKSSAIKAKEGLRELGMDEAQIRNEVSRIEEIGTPKEGDDFQTVIHYTSKKGAESIVSSGELQEGGGLFGNGVYGTPDGSQGGMSNEVAVVLRVPKSDVEDKGGVLVVKRPVKADEISQVIEVPEIGKKPLPSIAESVKEGKTEVEVAKDAGENPDLLKPFFTHMKAQEKRDNALIRMVKSTGRYDPSLSDSQNVLKYVIDGTSSLLYDNAIRNSYRFLNKDGYVS